VKRNGDKKIGIIEKSPSGLTHQLYKERQRLMLVLELEAHDKPTDDPSIMSAGPCPRKYRRVCERLH
jgi:hypothetical protein